MPTEQPAHPAPCPFCGHPVERPCGVQGVRCTNSECRWAFQRVPFSRGAATENEIIAEWNAACRGEGRPYE